ncbi:MAG: hypothetical protein V5A34_05655 [Halapricum sp.]
MTDVPHRDWPIDWREARDDPEQAERLSRWLTQERARRQHARQDRISPEQHLAVHERRETTVYCTGCGEEHTALHDAQLNYCRQCGASL